MSENTITPTDLSSEEIDLDAWLSGGERNTALVTLYARNALHADIQRLENQLTPVPEKKQNEEEALGGDPELAAAIASNAELQEQIDDLWQKIDASKKVFRVSGRTSEEIEAIQTQIRKDLSDELDRVAAIGRDEGKKSARRLGLTATDEINRMVRAGALEHVAAIMEFETAVRTIADSTTVELPNGRWVALSAEQVRKMYRTLGEAQVDRLAQAASRTSNEAPVVTVPKS